MRIAAAAATGLVLLAVPSCTVKPSAATAPVVTIPLWTGGDGAKDASRKTEETDLDSVRRTTYRVTLWNTHTRELAPLVEGPDVAQVPAAFFRCRVTGQMIEMDPALFPLALAMAERFSKKRIDVISAFRSPRHNESLRKKGRRVARRSQHVLGRALDFRLPGVTAQELAGAVSEVHHGGIGTYVDNGFVHVDTGRDRRWPLVIIRLWSPLSAA